MCVFTHSHLLLLFFIQVDTIDFAGKDIILPTADLRWAAAWELEVYLRQVINIVILVQGGFLNLSNTVNAITVCLFTSKTADL